jgi:nitroreductase
MKSILDWRYATKKYDTSKKLTSTQLDEILYAINSAPTAFGLQPFQLIHVKNNELRERLKTASFNQSQITDASDLIVFTVPKQLEDRQIDAYMNRIAEVRNVERTNLSGFHNHIAQSLSPMESSELISWNARQAYIALGFGLVMAAQLGIDSTPMEGFQKDQFNQILELDKEEAILVLALGYRAEDDAYQHHKKVRKTLENLVTIK